MESKDKITPSVRQAVKEAQAKADTVLRGDDRTTNLTLWDDGDFKIDIVHGYDDKREHIIWRSSSSNIYPAETFIFKIDRCTQCEETEVLHREVLD